MPMWSKTVLRTIGALDLILSIVGIYLLLDPISRGLLSPSVSSQNAPYFRTVFLAMIVSNGVLLLVFVLAAVGLLRLKKVGVTAHTIASVLLVAYDLLIGMLWATGGRFGTSVAAATGIGNLGLAPFRCFNVVPFLYPAVSTGLLLITRRKMLAALRMANGGA